MSKAQHAFILFFFAILSKRSIYLNPVQPSLSPVVLDDAVVRQTRCMQVAWNPVTVEPSQRSPNTPSSPLWTAVQAETWAASGLTSAFLWSRRYSRSRVGQRCLFSLLPHIVQLTFSFLLIKRIRRHNHLLHRGVDWASKNTQLWWKSSLPF